MGKGYASSRYRAWFTGMAPIDRPRIAVGVMLDEPSNGQYFGGFGGCARVQRNRAADLAHFGVTPDMGAKPQIVIEAAEESF